MLLLLTDVPLVFDGYGTPAARPVRHATPAAGPVHLSGRFDGTEGGRRVPVRDRDRWAGAIGALSAAPDW
jgi:hypothetical protein